MGNFLFGIDPQEELEDVAAQIRCRTRAIDREIVRLQDRLDRAMEASGPLPDEHDAALVASFELALAKAKRRRVQCANDAARVEAAMHDHARNEYAHDAKELREIVSRAAETEPDAEDEEIARVAARRMEQVHEFVLPPVPTTKVANTS